MGNQRRRGFASLFRGAIHRLVSLPGRLVPESVRSALLRLFGANAALNELYYLFRGSFRHEHRTVLQGRLKHYGQVSNGLGDGARFRLRRYLHGLEKGLIMRPRRPVWALAYIEETVALFDQLSRTEAPPESCEAMLTGYAADVLSAYFNAVGNHPGVEPARRRFEEAVGCLKHEAGDRLPHHRTADPSPVRYEDLHALARRRKSTRWFLHDPPSRELLDKAVLVALQAPSACNRQPFEFRIYDDPDIVRTVSSIPMGTAGFAEGVPCVVLIVGHQRAYSDERDRHLIYVDGALAAMSFQLALETLGLASCAINWPDMPAKQKLLRKTISLAPDEEPVLVLCVGVPDPDAFVPFSQRKTLDEIRSFNKR